MEDLELSSSCFIYGVSCRIPSVYRELQVTDFSYGHAETADIMNFLVTGGTGFIGAYTIRDLLREGHKVVSFDASPDLSIMSGALNQTEIEKTVRVFGDIGDLPLILNTIKAHGIERIAHFASLQIPASDANPHLAVKINFAINGNSSYEALGLSEQFQIEFWRRHHVHLNCEATGV